MYDTNNQNVDVHIKGATMTKMLTSRKNCTNIKKDVYSCTVKKGIFCLVILDYVEIVVTFIIYVNFYTFIPLFPAVVNDRKQEAEDKLKNIPPDQ